MTIWVDLSGTTVSWTATMEDYLRGRHRTGFYLQVDRALEESAAVQRREIHTLPAAVSLYSPSLLWLDQTARENPQPHQDTRSQFSKASRYEIPLLKRANIIRVGPFTNLKFKLKLPSLQWFFFFFLKESKSNKLCSWWLTAFPHGQKTWCSRSKDRTSGKKHLVRGEQCSPFSESWCLTLSKRLTWAILDNPQCTCDRLNAEEAKQRTFRRRWSQEIPKMKSKQASSFPGLPSNLHLSLLKIPSNKGLGLRCGGNKLVTDPQSGNPTMW